MTSTKLLLTIFWSWCSGSIPQVNGEITLRLMIDNRILQVKGFLEWEASCLVTYFEDLSQFLLKFLFDPDEIQIASHGNVETKYNNPNTNFKIVFIHGYSSAKSNDYLLTLNNSSPNIKLNIGCDCRCMVF